MDLPESAVLAWWATAWFRGHVGPDELLDALDGFHQVTGLDAEPVPLLPALGRLRSAGATSVGLALPAPGILAGLGGPGGFNKAALEAGEAVVLDGAGLGLVPHRAGAGVSWQLEPAARRQLVDLGEADRSLRTALVATADRLAALDVARWRPEVADELMNLRRVASLDAPPGTPAAAVDLATRAGRAAYVVELALEDDGGAVSAWEIAQREEALRPLDLAARHAVVAACSPEVWPPG